MTDAATPAVAEITIDEQPSGAPSVRILLMLIEGADLGAALSLLGRQVYEPAPEVVIVGKEPGQLEDEHVSVPTLEEAIAEHGSGVDYFWILHSDARPRPDALSALVAEVERNDASLGGSKLLLAGSHDELESVGSATDVFGEPYSGLDEGEIDLQQYDVVREVAFVRSASMLVRRDLAQGLRGLDPLLPPIAAGLDFSQRTRLAGGRVVIVPSSEVYHQGRCVAGGGKWREQAGRLRAMLTAYSPLTLLWLVPYDLAVSVADSLASLLLLRWRPAVRHALSWGWNLLHLPSTFGQRRRLRSVRAAGDEELFRFQARGSVRLREIGSELSGRLLSLFDDDQALARGTRRIWASPGIWGAFLAGLVVAFSARSLVFSGIPDVGFSLPLEPPGAALDRWWAGWNQSGLGSPSAVHPSVGIGGVVSWLWLGAQGAARTVMTIAFGFLAVVGVGRLAGRLGLRGPGRYLAGLVMIGGPGTALLTGAGSWLVLGSAAFLPWAVRAVFVHPHEEGRSRLASYGWAVLLTIPLASFSPVLAIAPLVVALMWKAWGGGGARLVMSVVALTGAVVAVPFVMGDPGWITDQGRRLALSIPVHWPVLIAAAALPLALSQQHARRLGTVGAVVALASAAGVLYPGLGPGLEEALLVSASFGAALVVAAGMDVVSARVRMLPAVLGSVVLLALSVAAIGGGRLGLPPGDINEQLAFADTLAGPEGPGRTLIAAERRDDIPGEARPGPGFWYRLVEGRAITLDQAWLPAPLAGDEVLDGVIDRIAAGAELRPGSLLAPFAVDWVVLVGPRFRLDDVFLTQIDLVPTPLDPDSRVFENPGATPKADGGFEVWRPDGTGFAGEPGSGRVTLSLNHADGWSPESGAIEWYSSVSAAQGRAAFRASGLNQGLVIAVVVLMVAGLLAIASGRRRTT